MALHYLLAKMRNLGLALIAVERRVTATATGRSAPPGEPDDPWPRPPPADEAPTVLPSSPGTPLLAACAYAATRDRDDKRGTGRPGGMAHEDAGESVTVTHIRPTRSTRI
jgi:hypothetical protein